MARIELLGLTKRYRPRGDEADRARPALDALDLEIAEGELLVLVGPSGCGKSTALRLIAGLEEPSRGRVEVDGVDLTEVAARDRYVAMVFQGYALYPHMSVREIIAFPLKMRGVGAAERAARVAKTARMIGLESLLDRLPGELSGGERQRVAMGRAIVREPKVFLFDEPLSNLDAKLRTQLRVDLVALLAELGTTAVYVTHDQAEAMTMGDRIAVLKDGVLQQVGTPRAVYDTPANVFVASFIGTPAMSLIELDRDGQEGAAGGVRVALPDGAAGELIMGLRPEHVGLRHDATVPAGEVVVAARARVVSVEPLGAESFVHLEAEGEGLRARVGGFADYAVGDELTATADPEALHWFDRDSGVRLS